MIDALHSLTETGENLSDLLRTWRAAWPGMGVLILLPEAETARIPALQAACREAEVPMLGAVFPALITDRGFAVRGGWLLRFDTMPPAFLVADLDDDAGDAARTIAARVEPHLRPDAATDAAPMLFMIFDAMLPAIGSILSGLFCELGTRIRYAGVNAGSETFQPMPCLFDRDRLVGAGMIGLLLDASAQVAVSHGYPVTRSLMSATSTRGNRVDRIDGRPAFDVYRDVIRAEFDIDLTHANFYDYAVHYPFGLVTAIDVLAASLSILLSRSSSDFMRS